MDASTARTENMRRLVDAAGGQTAWAERYGGTRWDQSRVNRWVTTNKPKPIGGKLARELEQCQGLEHGALDRPPRDAQSQSQTVGFDLATLNATTGFLSDLFAAHDKDFVVGEQLPLVIRIYDELRTTATPNLVEMGFRYGKELGNERQGTIGSVGQANRRTDGESARPAKASAGRKG